MNKVLVVLCTGSVKGIKYESILNEYQMKGFNIHEFTDLDENYFYPGVIEDIVEELNNNYPGGLDEFVILSNLAEAVFFWYRVYNSIADAFILFLSNDKFDVYKNIILEDKEAYEAIARFYGIEDEALKGKIHVIYERNSLSDLLYLHLLKGENYKYFCAYKYDDINIQSDKQFEVKSYHLKNKLFLPLCENPNYSNKGQSINLDNANNKKASFDNDRLFNIFAHDIALFFMLIIGLYRLLGGSFFKICFNFFQSLDDNYVEQKNRLIDLIKNCIDDRCSFVRKVNLLSWISSLQNKNWIFYDYVPLEREKRLI